MVVLGRQLGRGAISGAEVESQFGHVYEFADGKIVRAAYYLDEQRALEAAGAGHEAVSASTPCVSRTWTP